MAKQAKGIYFILAPDHHGTVLLSSLLNNHPDIMSLGDTNPLRNKEQICSCGEPVFECPFWTDVSIAVQADEEDPLTNLLPQAPYIVKSQTSNNMMNGTLAVLAQNITSTIWRAVYEQAERFLAMHERFLTACQTWIPHKAFVDGERSTLKFMVMTSMNLPVKGVIHLVRDPRAYAAMVKRNNPRITAEQLGLEWVAKHDKIRKAKWFFSKVPVCTVRYEDIAANPSETVKNILNFIGLKDESFYPAQGNSRKHHLIGTIPTEGSDEGGNWQVSLHPDDQAQIIAVCEPFFSQFGYKSQN